MSDSLDFTPEEFSSLINQTAELIINQYKQVKTQDGFHDHTQQEVQSWFDEKVPLKGMNLTDLFSKVQTHVLDSATGNLGPNMYAYVMAGGNQISTLAEFIASTINQNVTKWHLAPAMTEIEKRVIAWASEIIGYTPEAGGAMVNGGSGATLAGLTVGRNVFFKDLHISKHGLFGQKPMMVYCSTETHNSTDKSVALLGIGTDNIRKIKTNSDFTINLTELENQIIADHQAGLLPFCIVGNAGTVNTGAIDDLDGLADLAKKHNLWFHVDGAYGGLASALPHLKKAYSGIERADSVALDFHKWLYQPFEIGCVLVRSWSMMRESYFKQADYLETAATSENPKLEFNEHYFQLSRNAKAFKVWMSLKAYGFDRFRAMIQKDIDLTTYLTKQLEAARDFEVIATGSLAIVCFRYTGALTDENAIANLTKKILPALEADGRIFIAGTKLRDRQVLRACIINHRKEKSDIDYLIATIREVGEGVRV